jgi:hypothetical protein
MIRVGRYDAFDKWEILCRYWQDNRAVPDPGVDKFDRPLLPGWERIARARGSAACFDYLRAKVDSLRSSSPDDAVGDGRDIDREISRLLQQIGYDELQARARHLAKTIALPGFHAADGNGLPARLDDRLRDVFKEGALQGLRWTEDAGEIPTIEIVRAQAPRFPVAAIQRKKRVLCVFCAWFYGRSDIIHVHDACPEHVTLVDLHAPSLEDIQLIYPRSWSYVCADYKEFFLGAEAAGQTFDLVVCDPFKGPARAVAWELLPTIMRLCSDTYVTNYFTEMFDELGAKPDDLVGLSRAVKQRTGVDVEFVETMERNSTVHWAVMRRR